jgi:chemotaxis protein MotB
MGKWLLGLLALALLVAAALAAAYVLYHQPLAEDLEDARREASLLAQERSTLKSRVSDLEHMLDQLRAESEELAAEVEAKEAQLAELQATQDELVGELEQEIADGQIQVQRLRGQLRVDMVDEILFDSGKATLKPEGQEVLTRVASVLEGANRIVQVQGHTDNVPIRGRLAERFPTNWELSAARAVNVVRFLQEEAGLDPQSLSATGLSEYRPRAANDTVEGRQKNRRIEILLVPPFEPGADEKPEARFPIPWEGTRQAEGENRGSPGWEPGLQSWPWQASGSLVHETGWSLAAGS